MLAKLLLLLCTGSAFAAVLTPGWTLDLHGNVLGVAAYPDAEHTEALVVTMASGRIVVVAPDGHALRELNLDRPAAAPALVTSNIIGADVTGSIYAFRPDGRRVWKYTRDSRATDFRDLAVSDLIYLGDSRGHIYGVDSHGKLQFDFTAANFRVSAPATIGNSIVFGDEDGHLYRLGGDGRVLWNVPFPGSIGRALPVATSLGGKPVVLVANPFVGRFQGVIAFDAGTGHELWRAPSYLQSYHSIFVTDLRGDGQAEILFGDKSNRLFCLDSSGRKLWAQHFDGRGIYFAPAIARLSEHGPATIFQIVRSAGLNGKSLYILDGRGGLIDSLPVTGGGDRSPLLYRDSSHRIRLLVPGSSGVLQQYTPTQDEHAAILTSIKIPPPAAGPISIRAIANPWAQHTPKSLVDEHASLPMRIHMLGNEYESAALAITNLTSQAVDLPLATKGLPSGAVEFHAVPYVIPDTTGVPQEDPLPLIDNGHFSLSPNETKELWLIIHSRDLNTGRHAASIAIGENEVPLEIEVSSIRLPDHLRYRHCNWLYLASIKDERVLDATIRDAVSHGTNVFNIPAATVQVSCQGSAISGDASTDDRLIPKLPGAFFLIDGSVNLKWPSGCHPSSSLDDAAYRNALRWFANHMTEHGVSAKDYALYIEDEPGLTGDGPIYQRYVAAVRRAKAADPDIQIFTNPAGGAWPDVLAPLDGLVDIWCPDLHLFRLFPNQLGAMFRKASQFWHYEAPSDQRRLDPLGFYRMKPWIAFQLGMNGGGYWVYSSTDYSKTDPAMGTEYGVVYPTPNGPVTSKRWEASRDGIEDFELLSLLRDAAQRKNTPEARQALALIQQAVAFATRGQENATDIGRQLRTYAPDYAQWMAYREGLIRAAEKLIR